MTKEQVKAAALEKRAGTIRTITYRKVLKTKKGVDALITKETITQGRLNVKYDNIKAIKEGRADGSLPETNAGLPRGTHWHEYPLFIASDKTGAISLRVTKANGNKTITNYFLNGCPVDKDVIKPMCYADEFKTYSGEPPTVINIGIEKIKSIK